jgi:hypothetical protein
MSSFTTRLQGPFAGDEPNQYPRQYRTFDPFANLPAESAYARSAIFNPSFTNAAPYQGQATYVGPRPEQVRATDTTLAALEQARPYYGTSVDTLNRTAGGGYLDVGGTPAYAGLQDSTRRFASDVFSDAADRADAQAARSGAFYSSARLNQRNIAAERLANQFGQYLADRAFSQYGQERGYQQGAAQFGAGLTPALASSAFAQGETLRAGEQQAAQFDQQQQLRAYLESRGLDQQAIALIIRYMQAASGHPILSLTGPSDQEANNATLQTMANAFGSVTGGKGAGAFA